jgi:putative transposase
MDQPFDSDLMEDLAADSPHTSADDWWLDGTLGLPKALKKKFPNAKQQRYITHKVRGIQQYLRYADLPPLNSYGQSITTQEGKRQRKFEITEQAYESYQAETIKQAKDRQFKSEVQQWESVEPEAVRLFLRDIDLTLTFYQFSPELYLHIQTTNHLERMFENLGQNRMKLGPSLMKQAV